MGVWMGEGGGRRGEMWVCGWGRGREEMLGEGRRRVCSEIVCVLFVTYDTWS